MEPNGNTEITIWNIIYLIDVCFKSEEMSRIALKNWLLWSKVVSIVFLKKLIIYFPDFIFFFFFCLFLIYNMTCPQKTQKQIIFYMTWQAGW